MKEEHIVGEVEPTGEEIIADEVDIGGEEIHAGKVVTAPLEIATREEGTDGEEDATMEEDATVDINTTPNDNVTETSATKDDVDDALRMLTHPITANVAVFPSCMVINICTNLIAVYEEILVFFRF